MIFVLGSVLLWRGKGAGENSRLRLVQCVPSAQFWFLLYISEKQFSPQHFLTEFIYSLCIWGLNSFKGQYLWPKVYIFIFSCFSSLFPFFLSISYPSFPLPSRLPFLLPPPIPPAVLALFPLSFLTWSFAAFPITERRTVRTWYLLSHVYLSLKIQLPQWMWV